MLIGDKSFKTKKELEEYVRHKLASIRTNSRKFYEVKNNDFKFLLELFKRHPSYNEKRGSGIAKILVGPNPSGASHIVLKRTDGTEIDISWKICISGRERSLNSVQKEILRNSIKDQIIEFGEKTPQICNICDSYFCAKFEIDHVIPFKTLVANFTKNTVLPTRYKEVKYGHEFHDDDIELETQWRQFHLENAKLQKVCKTCHYKKTYL